MDAVIHLASKRSCIQNEKYRSYRTANINDDTLAAGATVNYENVLLLPLIGDIVTSQRLAPGQAQIIAGSVAVTNPYKDELISYLVVQLNSNDNAVVDFDLDANRNSLIPLFPSIYLGKFEGRQDGTLKPDSDKAFIFVIEGAFEVQNRLLESRDGLSLSHVSEIEFEALSSDAILLVLC